MYIDATELSVAVHCAERSIGASGNCESACAAQQRWMMLTATPLA